MQRRFVDGAEERSPIAAAGAWEDWEWDDSLFAGCAQYYERGRPPYAPGLADTLVSSLELDRPGRLLDVGCGPGSVALLAARSFETVVGLDPDPGMLAEAERLAAERGIENCTWVRARAEALPGDLGHFEVATLGASFHWMDRPAVAAVLLGMLGPNGAAVQVDAPGYRPVDDRRLAHSPPPVPDAALDELRQKWLGRDRRAGRGIRNSSPSGEDEIFRSAGFLPAAEVTVADGRVLIRTVEDIVALALSLSSTAPHLFGARLDEFVTDLRRMLLEASPSGRFSVYLPDNTLRIWRPNPSGSHERGRL